MSGVIPNQGFHIEEMNGAGQAFADQFAAVNLDEVTTGVAGVAFVEYKTEKYTDEGGVDRSRRISYVRHARINLRVPNRVMHKMAAAYNAFVEQFGNPALQDVGGDDTARNIKAFDFMLEQVLAVWKLTEEDMDIDRLNEGLEMPQVVKLFQLFFNQQSRQSTGNPAPGGSSTSGSE